VAVDRDLAVGDLANRPSILARNPGRATSLLEKASVIKDQNRITLGRQFEHLFNALAIERIGVPLHRCQQALQLLFTRTRNYRRKGITVLVRVVSQQLRQIALQRCLAFPPAELNPKRLQEAGQLRQGRTGRTT